MKFHMRFEIYNDEGSPLEIRVPCEPDWPEYYNLVNAANALLFRSQQEEADRHTPVTHGSSMIAVDDHIKDPKPPKLVKPIPKVRRRS